MKYALFVWMGLVSYGALAQDGPGGVGSAKTGTSLSNNLLFWYKATDIAASNGQAILQWPAAGSFGLGTAPFLSLGNTSASSTTFQIGFQGNTQIPYVALPPAQTLERLQEANITPNFEMYVICRPVISANPSTTAAFSVFKIVNSSNNGPTAALQCAASDGSMAQLLQDSRSAGCTATKSMSLNRADLGRLQYQYKIGSSTESSYDLYTNTLQDNAISCMATTNDLNKLVFGDATSTVYNTLQIAEIFAFTSLDTAQRDQIVNYLKKYNTELTGPTSYAYDFAGLETLYSAAESNGLKIQLTDIHAGTTVEVGKIGLWHNLNGPSKLYTKTNASYPYLKLSDREWKVLRVSNLALTDAKIKLSFDQSILPTPAAGKQYRPMLLVRRGAQVLCYHLSLTGGAYEFTEASGYTLQDEDFVSIAYYEYSTCSITGGMGMSMAWGQTGNLPVQASNSSTGLTIKKNATTSGNGILHLYKAAPATLGLAAITATYFQAVTNEDWCLSKLGDATQTFDLVLDPSKYPALPQNYLSYVLLIDADGTGYLNNATDQVIYLRKNAGNWEAKGITLPNNARIKVAVDVMNSVNTETAGDDYGALLYSKNTSTGSLATITNSILTGKINGDAITTTNVANVTFLKRYWIATASKKVKFSIKKSYLQSLLLTSGTWQPWHQIVFMEANTGGSPIMAPSKLFAAAEEGDLITYEIVLTAGKYYTFGVLNMPLSTITATHTALGSMGKIDQGYSFDKIDLSNKLRLYANKIGLYNHVVLYETNTGTHTLTSTAETLNGMSYQRYSKTYRLENYNTLANIGKLDYLFYSNYLPTLPTGYSYILISDANGTWGASDTDRKITGLVKQGQHYYAFGMDPADKYFTIGIAQNAVTEARVAELVFKEAVNSALSQPGSPASLIIKEKKNFEYASSCSTRVDKNILKVTLNTGKDYLFGLTSTGNASNFTITLNYKLSYFDQAGTQIGTVETKDLSISAAYPEAMFSKVLPVDVNKVTVEMLSLAVPASITDLDKTKLQNALEFRAKVLQDLKYYIPQVKDHALLSKPSIVNVAGKPVTFTWANEQCPAAGYRFQLLRLYNTNATYATEESIQTEVDWSKALTLDLPNPQAVLQLAEGTGFYAWRVQPYGSIYEGGIANSDNWGNWSTDNIKLDPTVNLSSTDLAAYESYVLYHEQLENDKNFIYNRVFTEDGKIHESFSVANGILQGKQSQSKLNSNAGTSNEQGSLVISQNIYDYSGRPALSVLPAPLINPDSSTLDQNFGYRSSFMTYKSGALNLLYGPWNIDQKPGSTLNTLKNDSVSGSSIINTYYSNKNPDKQIPSAQGYPFARAVYSVDGNNTVIEQGGVGKDHQPGTGHTVKVNTAIASVDELIRIFGDETPAQSTIYRNSIQDQNGVTSVTYANKSGKTIATCLVVKDVSIDPSYPHTLLPSSAAKYGTDGKVAMTQALLNIDDNAIQGDYVVSYKDINLPGATSVTLDYAFTPLVYGSDFCAKFCVSCGYDVEISIINLNTNVKEITGNLNTAAPHAVFVGKAESLKDKVAQTRLAMQNITLSGLNHEGDNTYPITNPNKVSLPAGKYRILKILKPKKQGAEDVATQIQTKLTNNVDALILQPLMAALKADQIRGVNQFITQQLLVSSTLNTSIQNAEIDLDVVLYDAENTVKMSLKGHEALTWREIQDGYTLSITTSSSVGGAPCVQIKIPLFAHVADLCSPREYLSFAQLQDTTSDIKQLYSASTAVHGDYIGTASTYPQRLAETVSNELFNLTMERLRTSTGSTLAIFENLYGATTVDNPYDETAFKGLISNIIKDQILWKQDSLALPLSSQRALLNEKFSKNFRSYGCPAVVNAWKGTLERYFPLTGDAALGQSKPSGLNPGDQKNSQIPDSKYGADGKFTSAVDASLSSDPMESFLDLLGAHYVGYVDNESEDLRTTAYKLFHYPRSDADQKAKVYGCETFLCTPGTNGGTEYKNPEVPEESSTEVIWPDLSDSSVVEALCSQGMLKDEPSSHCNVTAVPGDSMPGITYTVLKVGILGSPTGAERFLTATDYGLIETCFHEMDLTLDPNTDNVPIQFDDLSRAAHEAEIVAKRTDLITEGQKTCDKRYEDFKRELKALYDPDHDGKYQLVASSLGNELISNGTFENGGDFSNWYNYSIAPSNNIGDPDNHLLKDKLVNSSMLIDHTTYYSGINWETGSKYQLTFSMLHSGSMENHLLLVWSGSTTLASIVVATATDDHVYSYQFTAQQSFENNLRFAISNTGPPCYVDNLSLKKVNEGTVLTESDICCTAQSLVENCKRDCQLTLQTLTCEAFDKLDLDFYAHTSLNANWKKTSGLTNISKASFLPQTLGGFPQAVLGDVPLTVAAKHHRQISFKTSIAFSDGTNLKNRECKWYKSFDSDPSDLQVKIRFDMSDQAQPLQFKLNSNAYEGAGCSQQALFDLLAEQAKVSKNCEDETPAAYHITEIKTEYSYDGVVYDHTLAAFPDLSSFNLTGINESPSFDIAMTENTPELIVSLKSRFMYSQTKAPSLGKYYESCLDEIKIPAGDLSQGTTTLKLVAVLLEAGPMSDGLPGQGYQVHLVNPANNNKVYLASSSTCKAKDLFKALVPKADGGGLKQIVAPGTIKELEQLAAITYGTYSLKLPAATSAGNTALETLGYQLKPQADVTYHPCEGWTGKMKIKWQKSLEMRDRSDHVFVRPNGDYIAYVNDLVGSSKSVLFNKENGMISEQSLPLSSGFIESPNICGINSIDNTSAILFDSYDYANYGVVYNSYLKINFNDNSLLSVQKQINKSITPETFRMIEGNNGYLGFASLSTDLDADINVLIDRNITVFQLNTNMDLIPFSNGQYGKILDLPTGYSYNFKYAGSVLKSTDGSIYVLTEVNSADPLVPLTHGERDIMLIKLRPDLSREWFQVFGGNDQEYLLNYVSAKYLIETPDGNVIFVCSSQSKSSGNVIPSDLNRYNVPTDPICGDKLDYWVVKVDKFGTKIWDKTFGGSNHDYPIGGIIKFQGKYVIAGKSFSTSYLDDLCSDRTDPTKLPGYSSTPGQMKDGSMTGAAADAWFVTIDESGNKLSDIALGGNELDYPLNMVTNGSTIFVSNFTNSTTPLPGQLNDIAASEMVNANAYDNWFLCLEPAISTTCTPQSLYLKWIAKPVFKDSNEVFPRCYGNCDGDPVVGDPTEPTTQIAQALTMQLNTLIESNMELVKQAYKDSCAHLKTLKDHFSASYGYAMHHYTLYYYDRAGQLIKTVPPEGVEPLNLPLTPLPEGASTGEIAAYQTQIQAFRKVAPSHRLATTYEYNSLGQLVQQNTPDGGTTIFAYDNIGKLRFSQSARQQAMSPQRFSYTKYDYLVRIIEAGEAEMGATQTFSNISAQVENATFPTTGQKEYSVTVYSTPVNNVVDFYGKQRNLLNRVSYVYAVGVDGRKAITYYSYDVHGNVEWLVQDIPGFSQYHVGYEYDLVSNKVLKVKFNQGRLDAFYHKYSYDADNRILAVYTSKDNQIWDKDASYEYYKHGPLRRTVIGEDRVQGLDYTYTIHGWLKAINGIKPTEKASIGGQSTLTNDPGNDGLAQTATIQKSTALDEWAMALQYYAGDFQKEGSDFNSGFDPTTGNRQAGNLMPSQTPDANTQNLYNGNISAWLTRTPQDYSDSKATGQTNKPSYAGNEYTYTQTFRYDELNRITSSKAWRFSSNGDFTATEDFATQYGYDANGNLLSLKRNGFAKPNSSTPEAQASDRRMDELDYRYDTLRGRIINNKLRGVSDAVLGDIYTEDLSTQAEYMPPGLGNYEYDAIGNLVKDRQERLDISWTASGKVSQVTKELGGSLGQRIIKYTYDAMGNRATKETYAQKYIYPYVFDHSITGYARDAQGNTLAVYDKQYSEVGNYGNYSHLFRQKEVYLYGSSRLGVYSPDQQVANNAVVTAGLGNGYRYEDAVDSYGDPQRVVGGYYQNTLSGRNYRYTSLDRHVYNTTTGNYESPGRLQHLLPARMDRSILQGLDPTGTQAFYGFTARRYLNRDNVTLLFGTDNRLLANSQGIIGDASAGALVLGPTGSFSKYLMVTRGTDQKLYCHTVDPSTGVTTKNQVLGTQTGYGTCLAAVNNHVEGYYMLYATRYSAGTLTLVGIRMSYNATAQTWTSTEYAMYTVATGTERAEIKVDVEHHKLMLATFERRTAWFGGIREPVYQIFSLGQDHRVADIGGTPPTMYRGSGMASTASLQFEMVGYPDITPIANFEGIAPTLWGSYLYGSRHEDTLSSTLMTKGVDNTLYCLGGQGQSFGLSETNPYYYSRSTTKVGPAMWAVPGTSQLAKPHAYYPVQVLNVYGRASGTEGLYTRRVGSKAYELSDHLGNVTVTVSDLKRELPNLDLATYGITTPLGVDEVAYAAQVLSYTNYYAFGMSMPGRNKTSTAYRYGFNGKENDKEWGTGGLTQDYGFRMYNPAIAKFLSVDPLASSYPWYTPYQFAGNKPIRFIDLDGLEEAEPGVNNSIWGENEMLPARLVMTTYFDLKHSIFNVLMSPIRGHIPFNGQMKLNAAYAKDEYGNEIFETTYGVVPTESKGKEALNIGLDLVNVLAAGKMDAGDFISMKIPNAVSQTTKIIREIAYKTTATVQNANLSGSWTKVKRNGNGMDYQTLVTGRNYDKATGEAEEFVHNGVHFDGYSGGILYEAKDKYKQFINKQTGDFWFDGTNALISEANRQISAAGGNHLRWVFSERETLEATRRLLERNEVDVNKIEFMYLEKTK